MSPSSYPAADAADVKAFLQRPTAFRRSLLDVWLGPHSLEGAVLAAAIGVLIALAATITYETGGTRLVHVHFAYLPIILGSLVFGVPGGVAAGIVAGLAVGPLMPLDVATGEMQSFDNWLARLGFFVLAGSLAGAGSHYLKGVTLRIRRSAYFDEQTGLPNLNALAEVLNTPHKGGRVVYVVKVGNVSSIASAFGFAVTDELLKTIAGRLRRLCEDGDFILSPFRIGGAEFALLSTSRDSPPLLEVLREHATLFGVKLAPEASIGYVEIEAGRAVDPGTLLREAMSAADEAAETGAFLATFKRDEDHRRRSRLELLGQLEEALETPQVHLVYQPKIRLADGTLAGCEALVRWDHPTRGNIPPGLFVPLAEETGVMWPLTQAVLGKALAQVAEWRRQGSACRVSVNFSARDFVAIDFTERLEAAFERAEVPRDLIEIEVTETAFSKATDSIWQAIHDLADGGIDLAIDDYGVGMSSLSYLKNIPASVLKIDQVFIRGLARDAVDRAIVSSTIDLAHDLGLMVVAEGVEDGEIAHILNGLGCDLAQGYHFAKPLPPDEFAEAYLRR